jgi:hypothetical protein
MYLHFILNYQPLYELNCLNAAFFPEIYIYIYIYICIYTTRHKELHVQHNVASLREIGSIFQEGSYRGNMTVQFPVTVMLDDDLWGRHLQLFSIKKKLLVIKFMPAAVTVNLTFINLVITECNTMGMQKIIKFL